VQERLGRKGQKDQFEYGKNDDERGNHHRDYGTRADRGGGSNGGSGGNSGGSSGGSGSGGGSFWSGNKKTTGVGDTIKGGDACRDCRRKPLTREGDWISPQGISSPGGMAGWRVSEPYLNLWLADQPLAYQPVKGYPISLLLAFKQRGEEAGSDMGIFNFSPSWNCSWLSYVLAGANPVLSADVLLPGGGYSHFELTSGWGTNYYNNFRLQVVTDGSGAVLSYQLFKPDGGKIIYDFFRTDSFGSWGYVFMTQQINSAGQATVFQYPGYDPDTGTVQLKYVIDGDGRAKSVSYLADDTYFKNRVSSVTDPFGRTASFGRAGSSSGLGNVLTNITDVVGMNIGNIGVRILGTLGSEHWGQVSSRRNIGRTLVEHWMNIGVRSQHSTIRIDLAGAAWWTTAPWPDHCVWSGLARGIT